MFQHFNAEMLLLHLLSSHFWSSYFLQLRHLIITFPPSETPRPCHFMMPAYGCHNLLSSPWAPLLSLRRPAASASCMTACFPAATLVTAYRWRRGACFTNDACSTGASWGCRRRQRESVQHACYCWLSHSLMYPPARRQCAIHSAVIQSYALARQMVLATHCPAPQKSAELWDDLQANFKHRFQAGIKVLLCFCPYFIVLVGEPAPCVGFKWSQSLSGSGGIPVNLQLLNAASLNRCPLSCCGRWWIKTLCSPLQVNCADLSE